MIKVSKGDRHYHMLAKKAGRTGVIRNSGILSDSSGKQKNDATPNKHKSLLNYAVDQKTKKSL